MNTIDSDCLAEMKAKGIYDYFTFPGGYELFYITAANRILCPDCANNNPDLCRDENDKEWNIVAYGVHWEGQPLMCDNCNKTIESEYGDSEEDDGAATYLIEPIFLFSLLNRASYCSWL